MTTKRKKATGSKGALGPEEFAPKNVKIRITTFIDQDVLRQLRLYASNKGLKYQTALNHLLRVFFDESTAPGTAISEERVRQIVKEELKKLG